MLKTQVLRKCIKTNMRQLILILFKQTLILIFKKNNNAKSACVFIKYLILNKETMLFFSFSFSYRYKYTNYPVESCDFFTATFKLALV